MILFHQTSIKTSEDLQGHLSRPYHSNQYFYQPTKNIGDFLRCRYNFYRCRLQISLIFGLVFLTNLPTRVYVCPLKVVTPKLWGICLIYTDRMVPLRPRPLRPKHDHNHVGAYLEEAHFAILGYFWCYVKCPFYTVEH